MPFRFSGFRVLGCRLEVCGLRILGSTEASARRRAYISDVFVGRLNEHSIYRTYDSHISGIETASGDCSLGIYVLVLSYRGMFIFAGGVTVSKPSPCATTSHQKTKQS